MVSKHTLSLLVDNNQDMNPPPFVLAIQLSNQKKSYGPIFSSLSLSLSLSHVFVWLDFELKIQIARYPITPNCANLIRIDCVGVC